MKTQLNKPGFAQYFSTLPAFTFEFQTSDEFSSLAVVRVVNLNERSRR